MKRRKWKNHYRRYVRKNHIHRKNSHGYHGMWSLLVHYPNLWPERTGWKCGCGECTEERSKDGT